jgi:hypothetical protein
VATSSGRGADVLQIVGAGVAGPEALLEELDVREDGHEEVVEVVRHAAREPADALQLLRLGELGPQAVLLGDVAGHAEQALDAAVLPAHRHGARLEDAPRPAQPGDLELQPAAPAGHHLVEQADEPLPVPGDEVGERLRLGLGQRPGLEHGEAGRVHLEELAVAADHLHALRLGLDDRAQPLLAPPERLLGLAALGDVPADEDEAGEAAAPVAQRRRLRLDLQDGAAPPVLPGLDPTATGRPGRLEREPPPVRAIGELPAQHVVEVPAEGLRRRPAVELLGGAVQGADPQLRVERHHGVLERVEDPGLQLEPALELRARLACGPRRRPSRALRPRGHPSPPVDVGGRRPGSSPSLGRRYRRTAPGTSECGVLAHTRRLTSPGAPPVRWAAATREARRRRSPRARRWPARRGAG